MSGIFGWSYPPGCNGTPFDEDCQCQVCGQFEDDCICPECATCGDNGNPSCYEEGSECGMVKNDLQKHSYDQAMIRAEAEAQAEAGQLELLPDLEPNE